MDTFAADLSPRDPSPFSTSALQWEPFHQVSLCTHVSGGLLTAAYSPACRFSYYHYESSQERTQTRTSTRNGYASRDELRRWEEGCGKLRIDVANGSEVRYRVPRIKFNLPKAKASSSRETFYRMAGAGRDKVYENYHTTPSADAVWGFHRNRRERAPKDCTYTVTVLPQDYGTNPAVWVQSKLTGSRPQTAATVGTEIRPNC